MSPGIGGNGRSVGGRAVPSLGAPHMRPPEVEHDTGKGPAETGPPPGQPGLKFEVAGVTAIEHAAAPTLSFALEVTEPAGLEIFMAGLSVQIQIEPSKRRYDDESREKLTELFGDPHRWATTAQRMLWSIESVLIPSFTGSTTVEMPVLCNFDLELAAAKYFYSVSDGEIPLAFHFNGSVYYADESGKLQVIQVPWDTVADYQMPVDVWKRMIDSYYPHRGWIPVHRETLDALQRLKARRGAATFDAAIAGLLASEAPAAEMPEPAMRPPAEDPPEKA